MDVNILNVLKIVILYLYTIYLNCRKISNVFVQALETSRKASLWRAFLVQINFLFTDNALILCLLCNAKKSKTTVKLSEKSINDCPSNCFQLCPL